jgi:hypothetical protein
VQLVNVKIINTLIRLKSSGVSQSTLEHVSYRLSYLDRNCDLDNPSEVCKFIAYMKAANNYNDTFAKSYNYYVQMNGLRWNKPVDLERGILNVQGCKGRTSRSL